MTRNEFLRKIEYGIRGLEHNDKISVVKYYDELISDKIEAMGSEEKAIESFGSLDRIILDILSEYNVEPQKKSKVKATNIIIIILLFPVWISVLASVAGLVISLWAVVFGLGVASLAMFVSSVYGFCITFLTLYNDVAYSLLAISVCLILAGLSILLAMLVGWAAKNMAKATGFCVSGIKYVFVRSASL